MQRTGKVRQSHKLKEERRGGRKKKEKVQQSQNNIVTSYFTAQEKKGGEKGKEKKTRAVSTLKGLERGTREKMKERKKCIRFLYSLTHPIITRKEGKGGGKE